MTVTGVTGASEIKTASYAPLASSYNYSVKFNLCMAAVHAWTYSHTSCFFSTLVYKLRGMFDVIGSCDKHLMAGFCLFVRDELKLFIFDMVISYTELFTLGFSC